MAQSLGKAAVTTPALKYGPTSLYGACEALDCEGRARVSCTECDGHFCRRHEQHDVHHSEISTTAQSR